MKNATEMKEAHFSSHTFPLITTHDDWSWSSLAKHTPKIDYGDHIILIVFAF